MVENRDSSQHRVQGEKHDHSVKLVLQNTVGTLPGKFYFLNCLISLIEAKCNKQSSIKYLIRAYWMRLHLAYLIKFNFCIIPNVTGIVAPYHCFTSIGRVEIYEFGLEI